MGQVIQFPEQRIAREAPVEKLWRWWTGNGWSWDVRDKYQSLTLANGETLRIPIFFDRREIRVIDVFQIWFVNIRAVNRLSFRGYFDVFLNGTWTRRQFLATGFPPEWGTTIILNFDDSDIKYRDRVIFDVRYYGNPLFIKSLELYSVIVPASR